MPPSSVFTSTVRVQKGQQFQATGRQRGGIITKIHAIADALGYPLRIELTAGNQHDCVKGYEILQSMDLSGKTVLADQGYEMNNILNLIQEIPGVYFTMVKLGFFR